MNYYLEPFNKFATFKGRASVSEYWIFFFVNFILSYIVGRINSLPVLIIWFLFIITPTIAVTIRRLHDTNRSGWWFLFSFIPVIGWVTLFIFLASSGSSCENKYDISANKLRRKAEGKNIFQKITYEFKKFFVKKKLMIVLGVLLLSISIFYLANKSSRYNIIENKKRLVEVSISRENIFWDCFSKKVYDEQQKWENSAEYLEQKIKYDSCLGKEVIINSSKRYNFGIRCSDSFPNRPWQLHNEIAGKYCSEIADNTQDGLLAKSLRKKVPITALTDYELSQIVKEKRHK